VQPRKLQENVPSRSIPTIDNVLSFSCQRYFNTDRYRSEDLNMGAVFNARERTFSEWKALFIEADARFILKSVNQPKGSTLSLIEVEWTP
jgi:hypothetical protein